jgi:hypothetical protein
MGGLCKSATDVLPDWIRQDVNRKCAQQVNKIKRTTRDVEHLAAGDLVKISRDTQIAIASKLIELGRQHSAKPEGIVPALNAGGAVSAGEGPQKDVKIPTIEFDIFDGTAELDVTLKATLKSHGDLLSTERVNVESVMIKWTVEF